MCFVEWWESGACEGEISFESVYNFQVSTCIPASTVYPFEYDPEIYYTPTSSCYDAECMHCENYLEASAMGKCVPCLSDPENCSYMEVDCDSIGDEESMDESNPKSITNSN